jgi:hypothetical protein
MPFLGSGTLVPEPFFDTSMKIFVSWSGDASKKVAQVLRSWIPNVLQSVEPWMSSKDIASGTRWSSSIASTLRDCKFGIICVTPENVAAPWLHFEAGALSKDVEDAFVCPLLFRLEPSELVGPMALFQAQRFSKEGVLEILQSIRSHPDQSLKITDSHFVDTFDRWWPDLEKGIGEAERLGATNSPSRATSDITAETLEVVRAILREVKPGSGRGLSTKLDEIRDSFSGPSLASSISDATRSVPPAEIIRKLVTWDATLISLLHGERNLRDIVDAILGNHIGDATARIMAATSYDLPKARTMVDSLVIAISRLGGPE